MKFTTQFTKTIKGLKLIYQRRHALDWSEIRKSCHGRGVVFAILITGTVLGLKMLSIALNPQPLQLQRYFGDYIYTLNIGWEAISLLTALIASIMLAISITIAIALCHAIYTVFLNNLSTKQNVATNHGNTLAEVIRGFQTEPVEHTAVFTHSGKKIDETTNYNMHEVCTCDKTRRIMFDLGNCIKVHNHSINCASFSSNDVVVAILRHVSKTIVVTQDFVYTLELTPECWKLDTKEVHDQWEQAYKQLRTFKKAASSEENIAFILGLNAMLAEQLGMKLTVEHFEDCQYLKNTSTSTSKVPACALTCNGPITPSNTHRNSIAHLIRKFLGLPNTK